MILQFFTCTEVQKFANILFTQYLYKNHVHGNLIESSYDDSESSGINKPGPGCSKLTTSLVS